MCECADVQMCGFFENQILLISHNKEAHTTISYALLYYNVFPFAHLHICTSAH